MRSGPVRFQDLPQLGEAEVYKAGRRAGRLVRREGAVEFAYLPEYVHSGGPPVATSLPLSTEPCRTPAGALPPFFSGLLPEGRRLTALRLAVKTSADDELSLLLAVGADTVGDVVVVPAGVAPEPALPLVEVGEWDKVHFGELLAASVGSRVDRVGMAGVQDKVSARMITLPVDQAGRRFMLKLDPPEFRHLVENEAFFVAVARSCGITTADAVVVRDADGAPGLLVTRFDRETSSRGEVVALAQEDGCQVLGRYPADKYAVGAEEVLAALVGVTRARPVAARELFGQLVFAYLSGNGDAHAKNFSVLRRGGEWRAAPAYDLPSSYPYGDHTMALAIGGRRREEVRREELLDLASTVGLRERPAVRVIDDLTGQVETWLPRLDELPFDARTIHKMRRFITHRRDALRR